MYIYDFTSPLPHDYKGAVIAIGNFDACHRGHQSLFEIARKRALHTGAKFAVLTFEPHPRSLFRPSDPPFRITPNGVKHERIQTSGADALFELPFNSDLINMSADEFVQTYLKEKLSVSSIVCGADFHFGHNRTGSISTLIDHNLHVISTTPITDLNDITYSSTRARACLKKGEMTEANAILGWNWFIRGTVETGDKRGRTIGFPTANITLHEVIAPAYGVYAARVKHNDTWYKAAVNIGIRPTFATQKPLLEAHIFEFDKTIYDDQIDVQPILKIRDEQKFSSLDELKNQINLDCTRIKQALDSYA